jgi:hypothetical protein
VFIHDAASAEVVRMATFIARRTKPTCLIVHEDPLISHARNKDRIATVGRDFDEHRAGLRLERSPRRWNNDRFDLTIANSTKPHDGVRTSHTHNFWFHPAPARLRLDPSMVWFSPSRPAGTNNVEHPYAAITGISIG